MTTKSVVSTHAKPKEKEEKEQSHNSRKLNAFTWWNRLGRPNKKAMMKRLQRGDMANIDLTPEDVELLPWIMGGFMVDITTMMTYMSKVETPSPDRKKITKNSKGSASATNLRKSKRTSATSISKSSLSVLSELESLPLSGIPDACDRYHMLKKEDGIADDDSVTCDTSICSFSTYSTFMEPLSSADGTWGSLAESGFDEIYELDTELNRGGFGRVHKTFRKSNPLEVFAVKVFERTGDENSDKNATSEAEILRELQDVPSVINLIDFHLSEDRIYMVQELARGGDIFERILQHGSYEETSARCVARTLLETVHTMHTRFNLVHRDIKPENVLLRSLISETDIVLCDFGSARYLPNQQHRGLLTTCGTTPAFSSPEIIQRIEYREEVDIWSIGCVLFILLGGYSPFEGNNDDETSSYAAMGDYGEFKDDEIWDCISDDAKDLIQQMLTVDRHQRCTSSQALEHTWFS